MRLPSRRWQLSIGATAVIAGTGVFILLHGLETALRAPINAYIRARTLAVLNETELEGLTIDFPALDLSLLRRRLVIRDLKIRYSHRDSTRYVRFAATTPRVTLSGLDLTDILWHRNLRLTAVHLSRPNLSHYREVPNDTTTTPPHQAVELQGNDTLVIDVPALDTLVYDLVENWLPDEVRGARIDLIAAEEGAVVSTTVKGGRTAQDSTDGLALRIMGIALDSARRRVFESADLYANSVLHVARGERDSVRLDTVEVRLDPADTVISVRHIKTLPADSGPSLSVTGLRRWYRDQRFSADTIRYEPLLSDTAWLRRSPGRRSRVKAMAIGVAGRGLVTGGAVDVRVGRIDARTVLLDVLGDMRHPPEAPRTRRLWPQALSALSIGLRVDSLQVDSGLIRYAEQKADRPEPALIWWSDINALVTGLSNRPDSGGISLPAVMVASGKLMDKGGMTGRFEVPITAGPFSMAAEGKLTNMDLSALNPFLVTSGGIRITNGHVREASAAFTVRGGRALGRVTAVYDSFAIEVVDKATRKKGLLEKLKSIVANAMVLRPDNLPDDDGYRPSARIDYPLKRGETFWGMTWQSVRTGVVRMLKR